jgi:phosphoglycerol transferase MdoB-like AlkP superfamily enzyme
MPDANRPPRLRANFFLWLAGRGLALLRYAAIAAAAWVALQYSDDAVCAVIDAGLLLLPLGLFLALSGRVAASLNAAAAVAIFVYVMGEMKARYFGTHLALADLAFVGESANWTIVTRYPLLYGSLAGFFVFLFLLWLERRLNTRRQRSLRAGPGLRIAAAAGFFALLGFSALNRHHHQWENFRDDADCGAIKICGVMGRLVYSTAVLEYDPPAHTGDPAYFLDRMGALPPADPPAAAHPDVVIWLNESTFDFNNYVLSGAKLPRLPMFDADQHTLGAGPLRVHTFGGRTWLSEFSVLTGLVPDDFGGRRNLVFNTVAPRTTSNLVRLMKGNGYRAIVLMPTFKRFYGAGKVYERMGFDEVLTLRDFHEYDEVPGDEWDIATSPRLAEAAIGLLRRHRQGADAGKPLLLYLLSIMEHAPYSRHFPLCCKLDHAGISRSLAARLSDYIAKLRLLSESVTQLDRYLQSEPRPALFCTFGDHQAYFEEPQPPYRYAFPDPNLVTQYRLRSNFAAPQMPDYPILDIAYLPSLVADYSGLAKDPRFTALSAMRLLCKGKLDDCDDQRLVRSYQGYVYSDGLGLLEK